MSNTLIGSHTSTYLETEKNVRVAVESMNNLIREYVLKIIAADPTSTNLPTLIRESGMFTTVDTAGSYNYKLAELYQQGVDHDSVLQNTHSRLEKRNALKFDSLEVGGRNLLLNTADFAENWVFSKHSSETVNRQDVQNGILTLTGEQVTWKHYRQTSNDNAKLTNIIDNQPVALSYEARGDVQLRVFVRLFYNNRSSYNTVSLSQNVTSEWVRYKHTFKVSHADNSADAFRHLEFLLESYSIGTVQVRKVKLEKGTIATDWTPAPEDVATPYVAFTSSSGIWYLDAQAFLDDKNAWETVITNAMRSVSVNSRTPFQLLKSRLDSNKLQYLPL